LILQFKLLNKNKTVMKKIILSIASIVVLGAGLAMAQNPSQTNPSQTNPSQTTPTQGKSDMNQTPRGTEWSKVETSQVPSSIQESLKDDKYKGWESSGVYYNRNTRQYSVDAKSGEYSSRYFLDANGKSVTESSQKTSRDNEGSANTPPSNPPGTPNR
jgi:hypothetical protein